MVVIALSVICLIEKNYCAVNYCVTSHRELLFNGAWRSLVAHYTGGVGVVGSNPIAPTNYFKDLEMFSLSLFLLGKHKVSIRTH